VLADVPGHLPGRQQESEGIVRRGAKLSHALAEAVVRRVIVIVRKAYGGAFVAMNSRALGATGVFAWPGAEVGVMHARSAVAIRHRQLLAAVPVERHAAVLGGTRGGPRARGGRPGGDVPQAGRPGDGSGRHEEDRRRDVGGGSPAPGTHSKIPSDP
jgi:acetyl-CoA/propionyl-CoA carboxylase carboxyl transferase subunit